MDSSYLANLLENTFQLRSRSTDIVTEFRAALSTFLTMSYILLVNPQILSRLGIPGTDVVVSTALASAISSIFVGFAGNLPFGLAPGMGLSAYLVYGLVFGEGQSLKQAFTSCFVSGVVLVIFSVTGVSEVIMKTIPRSVKVATIVGMGLQIALVGMTSVNLVVANPQTIVGLGSLANYKIWFSICGLVMIGSLLFHQIQGAILIGIILLTILTWLVEDSFPSYITQFPTMRTGVSDYIDFANYDWILGLPGVISFLFIGIIDVSGIIFGMSSLAKLTRKDGTVPGSLYGFLAASIGTIISAATGGTPIIVYVESAAGIKEGGRTGLTAVIIGLLFVISLVFAPLFAEIPVTATSPVAILVGAMMMSQAVEIDWNNMSDAIPAFLTLTIMPLTFSITNGIVFGLLAAMMFYVTTGQAYTDLKQHLSSEGITLGNGYTEVDEAAMRVPSSERLSRSGSFNERAANLLDYKPLVRTPSLLLRREEAQAVRDANT
jgi:adenine/guanine/hypoxanthine permease